MTQQIATAEFEHRADDAQASLNLAYLDYQVAVRNLWIARALLFPAPRRCAYLTGVLAEVQRRLQNTVVRMLERQRLEIERDALIELLCTPPSNLTFA